MPIYEYQCGDCNSQFELLIRGDERAACPHCESAHLTKQLSLTATPASNGGSLPVCGPAPRSNLGGG